MKENVSISGKSTMNGGEYANIKCAGFGKILTEVVCESLKVSGKFTAEGYFRCQNDISVGGMATFNAAVDVKDFKLSGICQINGNLACETLKITGSLIVSDSIEAKSINLTGKIEAADIEAEEIKSSGLLYLNNDCTCEKFFSTGAVTIEGLLNAEEIEISLFYQRSDIKNIGGNTIRVFRDKFSKFPIFRGMLVADVIEGDNLELEYTKAKVVRGKNIILGKNCEIDLVEYSKELKIRENAFVRKENKIL